MLESFKCRIAVARRHLMGCYYKDMKQMPLKRQIRKEDGGMKCKLPDNTENERT
jgi:hypothetical protein